jgi:hypothetical protein
LLKWERCQVAIWSRQRSPAERADLDREPLVLEVVAEAFHERDGQVGIVMVE